MPKSQLEIQIEKATHENNVSEDWGLIMDIVDQINQTNNEKEAIRIITKRLNDRDPHVINNALTLLNACIKNCTRNFKLAVCSGLFIEELKQFVLKRRFYKLSNKLAIMIQTWSNEKEFQNDPALNLMPSLYLDLTRAGVEFVNEEKIMKPSNVNSILKKEEEDLAKAIQLSIKESTAHSATKQSSNSSFLNNNNSKPKSNEGQKVKALYDFEAVEENEITFKAGDILFVTDNSDQNWWKGYDRNGREGLFPSNFVTSDLAFEIETFEVKSQGSDKKVSFKSTVNVKEIVNEIEEIHLNERIIVDEKKIDECIDLLQNADPTGEIQPDSQEMLNLEEECYMMGPLIDQQLQKIDYKHAILEDLNLKILEAFQMYNNLMKDSLSKSNSFIGGAPMFNSNSMISNYASPNNTQQSNTISFVTAPPQTEASAHLLANQLNNFAQNNLTNPAVGLPSYSQAYNPYSQYNLPNEHLNANNFNLQNPNASNAAQADNSYQQQPLNQSVQYGQNS